MQIPQKFSSLFARPVAKMAPISVTNPLALQTASNLLKEGSVIALPTDTIYGFACCATDILAIDKLFKIKQRDENKIVAICVGRRSDVQKWAKTRHLPDGLLSALLPGPVTLILPCNKTLNPLLVSRDNKVGIRIPNYKFICDVARQLDAPVALTSANLSGEPSSVCVQDFKKLWGQLSGVFDGGSIPGANRSGSTIIDLTDTGYYTIQRDGMACSETSLILESFGLTKL